MTTLSLSAYAATHGASKQAAAKWKARGVLVFDGSLVDVEKSDERMRGAGLGRFKDNRREGKPTTAAEKVDAPAVVVGADGSVDDEALDQFVEQLLNGKFASTVDAVRVKENGLALKHLLAARREAGALIELDVAEKVVFKVARSVRDAWMGWPSQIAPLLAADLGLEVDRVLEALTPYVQQHLEQLGDPAVDFHDSGED